MGRRWRALSELRDTPERLRRLERRVRDLHREVRDVHRETRQLVSRLDRQAGSRGPDEEPFRDVVRATLAARRTLLGPDRLHILWQAVRNSAWLGLPALEVGGYRGGSAWFLAAAHRALAGSELELHVVDTFAGHVEGEIGHEDAEAHVAGHFDDTDVEEVRAYLAEFPGVHVHQGAFADVVGELPASRLGLAHVDVDLFEPTKDVLEFLGERLAYGGIAVVDDYGAPKCPGVAAAVEEILAATGNLFEPWDTRTQQLVLVRRERGR